MAGVFEQINGRDDFGRELDRAKGICVEFLKNKLPGNPTLLSVQMQLEFFQGVMRSGRNPTRKERKSIDMGLRLHREFEMTDDVELYNFKELISLLGLYISRWPSDKLASDPGNQEKIDWYGE